MDPQQQAVLNKVAWRLVPVLTLAYIVNYLDRTNNSVAALTMNKDLGLTATQFGIGAGILFISYTVFEIPSNLALYHFGARRWIARIMITWGLVSAATAFISGERSYYIARFALGAAEAGFFPGVAFYLATWFPKQYRSRMLAWFLVGIPASSVLAPVSGALLGLDGVLGLKGWQWLFLVEGLPAVVLGFAVLRILADRPETASFLEPKEREILTSMLAQEDRERPKKNFFSRPVVAALVIGACVIVAACVVRGVVFGGDLKDIILVGMTIFTVGMMVVAATFDVRVFICAVVQFGFTLGSYGVGFFLPLIIKTSGLSNFVVSLLTAIPYVFASVAMILWARRAEASGNKVLNLSIACALGAVGLVGAVAFAGNLTPALIAITVALIGITSARAVFWSIPVRFLTGVGAAAGLALINSIGTIGGTAGPSLMGWLKDQTGSFERGLLVMAAILAVTTLCAAALKLVVKTE